MKFMPHKLSELRTRVIQQQHKAAGLAKTVAVRDTDADWRLIGEKQPFWGVVSLPKFRSEILDANAKAEFTLLVRTMSLQFLQIFEMSSVLI